MSAEVVHLHFSRRHLGLHLLACTLRKPGSIVLESGKEVPCIGSRASDHLAGLIRSAFCKLPYFTACLFDILRHLPSEGLLQIVQAETALRAELVPLVSRPAAVRTVDDALHMIKLLAQRGDIRISHLHGSPLILKALLRNIGALLIDGFPDRGEQPLQRLLLRRYSVGNGYRITHFLNTVLCILPQLRQFFSKITESHTKTSAADIFSPGRNDRQLTQPVYHITP